MQKHIDEGLPVNKDIIAARSSLEHYAGRFMRECEGFGSPVDSVCPGFIPTWKQFVDQNIEADRLQVKLMEEAAFQKGRAAGQLEERRRAEIEAERSAFASSPIVSLSTAEFLQKFRSSTDPTQSERGPAEPDPNFSAWQDSVVTPSDLPSNPNPEAPNGNPFHDSPSAAAGEPGPEGEEPEVRCDSAETRAIASPPGFDDRAPLEAGTVPYSSPSIEYSGTRSSGPMSFAGQEPPEGNRLISVAIDCLFSGRTPPGSLAIEEPATQADRSFNEGAGKISRDSTQTVR
jgi:hypothetical protein